MIRVRFQRTFASRFRPTSRHRLHILSYRPSGFHAFGIYGKNVEEEILDIQGHNVIIDRDVAELYGVATKRINEAVSNNPDKFPEGYIVTLKTEEMEYLPTCWTIAS